jgi:hypothetical protein
VVPDYALMLLKLCGYTSELAVKRAFKRDPDGFLKTLASVGTKICAGQKYSVETKTQFEELCRQESIPTSEDTEFEFLPGTWDLLQEVFDQIVSENYQKSVQSMFRKCKKRNSSVPNSTIENKRISSSFCDVKNRERLNNLIRKAWSKRLSPTPDHFEISEYSRLIWSVKCPACSSSIKIFITDNNGNANFNQGGFLKHIEIHTRNSASAQDNIELIDDSGIFESENISPGQIQFNNKGSNDSSMILGQQNANSVMPGQKFTISSAQLNNCVKLDVESSNALNRQLRQLSSGRSGEWRVGGH